ncbi:hypothetical protein SASPL_146714 [Salvia splendens]|uniref:Uncharacterized protein n=1 Tax=Salvia splendens TaxID=180675 RepID=A0A8X8Z5Z2_SALSN|nr:hypothetical protein SASPL_146714 [Salvia splendens]
MLSPKSGARLDRMKRRSNSGKFHHRWKRKFFALLLIAICLATFLLMESEYSRIKMPPLISPPLQKPKIAFLFIARNRIPLDIVWDAFFQVDWGAASMIQAERILLRSALTDPFNERFLFLSDSCIPLYNFSYTYDYLVSSPNSFVDSFADKKESRYNLKMYPVISVDDWRKGSQWVVLTRNHAKVVVEDKTVFSIFQLQCKPAGTSAEHDCVPDEHYVQTLLTLKGLGGEIIRRSLTHSSWDLTSSRDPHKKGWHPVTYKLADATSRLIQSIKAIDNMYFETEYRREWCTSKGKPSPCFLFARKFTRPTALRLLNMSAFGFSKEATT